MTLDVAVTPGSGMTAVGIQESSSSLTTMKLTSGLGLLSTTSIRESRMKATADPSGILGCARGRTVAGLSIFTDVSTAFGIKAIALSGGVLSGGGERLVVLRLDSSGNSLPSGTGEVGVTGFRQEVTPSATCGRPKAPTALGF